MAPARTVALFKLLLLDPLAAGTQIHCLASQLDHFERFYKIDQMLRARGVVSLEGFLTELEVSRATFKRDMEYLRDRLHAPIVWDRSARGHFQAPGGSLQSGVTPLLSCWRSAG